MKILAAADALMSLSGHQRQQVQEAAELRAALGLLREAPVDEDFLELDEAPEGEQIVLDDVSTGMTLRKPSAGTSPEINDARASGLMVS